VSNYSAALRRPTTFTLPPVGFYARALLRDAHEFGLRDLVEFAAREGLSVRVEPASALDDPAWRDAELWGSEAEVPVEIDVSRRNDPESLLHDEVAEFDEALDDADERASEGIARVREHLASAEAIVAVRVLGSDKRTGPTVGNCVLDWYAQREGVLFQVDADGFYDGDELIVST
jgi:hypothetical protein